jgi:hypothetical protein
MNTVVFLGPSLPIAEAQEILDAVYLPPAGQSHVISAVTTYEPQVMAIIDGSLGRGQTVWHKEVLYALDSGVRVFGGGGLGALKALEMENMGMTGVGEVFRMFRSGELTDDDEVALLHEDAATGFRRLSDPMVNLRATFQRAVEKSVIPQSVCEQLTSIAKSLYYPERTLYNILLRAENEGIEKAIITQMKRFAAQYYVDLQRLDAIELLETIRNLPSPLSKASKKTTFAQGLLFDALYNRERKVSHHETDVSLSSVAAYAALHWPEAEDLNFNALNRELVQLFADLLGIETPQERIEKELSRFRSKFKLTQEDVFEAWLQDNDISREEFLELMTETARCRSLHHWLMTTKACQTRNTKPFLNELRLMNSYVPWAEKAAQQEQILLTYCPPLDEAPPEKDLRDLVVEHLRETGQRWHTHFADWATEAGFTRSALTVELMKSRLARNGVKKLVEKTFNLNNDRKTEE